MKRFMVLALLLGLTSCVVPHLSGRSFSSAPKPGSTMADVRGQWGDPSHTSWQYVGDTRYDVWTYRDSYKVVMPSFGGGRPTSHREYRFYSVTFQDGVVVGAAR
jgi:hypothetical protein